MFRIICDIRLGRAYDVTRIKCMPHVHFSLPDVRARAGSLGGTPRQRDWSRRHCTRVGVLPLLTFLLQRWGVELLREGDAASVDLTFQLPGTTVTDRHTESASAADDHGTGKAPGCSHCGTATRLPSSNRVRITSFHSVARWRAGDEVVDGSTKLAAYASILHYLARRWFDLEPET